MSSVVAHTSCVSDTVREVPIFINKLTYSEFFPIFFNKNVAKSIKIFVCFKDNLLFVNLLKK